MGNLIKVVLFLVMPLHLDGFEFLEELVDVDLVEFLGG